MDGGERVGLAAALRARLAAAGIEVPDDGGRLERDLALYLERLAALAAAADLGPADPPLTNPGSAPPWQGRPAPAGPPEGSRQHGQGPVGEPGGMVEAARLVRDGEASSAELVEASLARIEALDCTSNPRQPGWGSSRASPASTAVSPLQSGLGQLPAEHRNLAPQHQQLRVVGSQRHASSTSHPSSWQKTR
jgi:hypothetical protein